MNNRDELIKIRDELDLSYREIMRATGCSFYTVKSWFLHPDSSNARNIKDKNLNRIKETLCQ